MAKSNEKRWNVRTALTNPKGDALTVVARQEKNGKFRSLLLRRFKGAAKTERGAVAVHEGANAQVEAQGRHDALVQRAKTELGWTLKTKKVAQAFDDIPSATEEAPKVRPVPKPRKRGGKRAPAQA